MRRCLCSFVAVLLFIGLAVATGYPNDASYTYDQLNRLIAIEYSDGTRIEYTYDDLGNRITQNVFTSSDPVANFTLSPTAGVEPLSVAFTDQSSGTVSSWSWSFGDGGSSTNQNPVYTYNNAGTYAVLLTVSNGVSSSSQGKTVTVNPTPPVANFSESTTTGAAPLAVSFTDRSTGIVTGWSWSFGDGGTSTVQNPSHTFTNLGNYTVTLIAIGPGGNSNPVTTSIAVVPPPVAKFSANPTSGTAPLSVQFTDASTGSVTGWSWSFGDGGTSAVQNPNHTFTNPGTYTVTLTAIGPGGNSSPATTSITVIPPPPATNFSVTPNNGTAPLSVQFTDASTGSVTTWSWAFGDGATSTVQNPSHTYSTPGIYTVSLTAAGPGGSNTQSVTNCITATPPGSGIDQYTKLLLHGNGANNGNVITDATGNHTPTSVNSAVTSTTQSKFGGSSIYFNNSRVTYADSSDWYFSNGQDYTIDFWLYTASIPNYGVGIFGGQTTGTGLAVNDSRQIELLTNGSSNFVLTTHQVVALSTWNHIALVRHNGVTTIYLNGVADPVTYSGLYTDSHNGLSIGDLYDPSISSGYFKSTAFLQEFRLSQGIARWTSNFTPPQSPYTFETAPPVAGFSAYPPSGTAPLPVQFTDRTGGLATSWSWAFGDGGASTSEDPSHTFSTQGTYTVSMTAASTQGSSTATNSVTVNAPIPGIDQYTKLLLHGSGADNAKVITDATGNHTPTSVNSVMTSTMEGKFWGSSIYFNNSRITYADSSDWYFSNGQDFTIDFWLYTANLPNYGVGIFGGQTSGTALTIFSSEAGTAGQIVLRTNGTNNSVLLTHQVVALNTWNHIALVRYNGVTTIYLNGVADPVTYSGLYTDSHNGFSVGDVYDPSISNGSYESTAFLQEFRLSQGIARWTSNFTPPASGYALVTAPPVANFSAYPASGTAPLPVQFADKTSGLATSWSWTFGDGGAATSEDPSYTYSTPGTYTVSLTATSTEGSSTASNYVTVNAPVPGIDQYTKLLLHGSGADNAKVITDATGNHTPTSVNSVMTSTMEGKFWGSSIYFNNSRITYADSSDWYFSNGQDFTIDFWLYTANLPNYGVGIFGGQTSGTALTIFSSEAGTAGQIVLRTNGTNNSVLLTHQVVALNTWNHIALVRYNGVTTIYLNGVADPVTYSGLYTDSHNGFSVGDVYDPSISNGSYESTAFLQEFRLSQGIARWTSNFTPPASGYALVTAPPVANFSAYPASGTAPLPVQFTDKTSGLATSWSWTFGDGGASTSEDPNYTYSTPGTYTVSLTAASTEGSSTADNYVTVNAPIPGIDQYTKLLLHGCGADNGDVITDATGNHTPASVNSVMTSTMEGKFWGSSIYFNNSRITYADSSDWYFSNGQDFTIDFWLYAANLPNYGVGIFGGQTTGTALAIFSSESGTAGQIVLRSNGAAHSVLLTHQLVTLNTWNHIALVRHNGLTTIYLNGVADPVTYTGAYTDSHNGFSIGDLYDPSISNGAYKSTAFLQEFRLSQGIARWTSNFTPPASAYGD